MINTTDLFDKQVKMWSVKHSIITNNVLEPFWNAIHTKFENDSCMDINEFMMFHEFDSKQTEVYSRVIIGTDRAFDYKTQLT